MVVEMISKNDLSVIYTGLYGETKDRFEYFIELYSKINNDVDIRKWSSFFLYHEEYLYANEDILEILKRIDGEK